MKFHFGKTKRPGWIGFEHNGYWLREAGDTKKRFVPYREPQRHDLHITRMFGLSVRGVFFGLLIASSKHPNQAARPEGT